MQLRIEVLPAPFGPIRHSSSPSRVSNETSCSTCRPPNARETLSSLRCSAIPAPAPAVLLDVAVAAAPAAGPDARSEIELADVLVRPQLFRCAVEHDAAVLQHVG